MTIPVSFDGYKSYLQEREGLHSTFPTDEDCSLKTSQRQAAAHHQAVISSNNSTPQNPAPYPPSFGEIIALISNGDPIPGIRDIPSTIVPEQASISKAPMRKKPWDKDLSKLTIEDGKYDDGRENIIVH